VSEALFGALGALISAALGAVLADYFGRKRRQDERAAEERQHWQETTATALAMTASLLRDCDPSRADSTWLYGGADAWEERRRDFWIRWLDVQRAIVVVATGYPDLAVRVLANDLRDLVDDTVTHSVGRPEGQASEWRRVRKELINAAMAPWERLRDATQLDDSTVRPPRRGPGRFSELGDQVFERLMREGRAKLLEQRRKKHSSET
jgi:hypothetical protein